MPSEVTRFQLARAPRRVCPDEGLPPLRLESWIANSELVGTLLSVDPEARRDAAVEWSGGLLARPVTSIADFEIPHAAQLSALDVWLTCNDNEPAVDHLAKAIERFIDREVATGATEGRFEEADPLYEDARRLAELMIVASIIGAVPTTQRNLLRALLVLGLVERVLLAFAAVDTPARVLALLRDRPLLLPRSLFPLPYRAAVARRPGFADMHVVRQEWNRYEAGEIGHIENVLGGELKRHVLTRTDETETTLTTATESVRVSERDSQSTSRFELSDETSTDTSTLVHVEGQIDTSGQYGPTKVDTHLGGSLDFSQEVSERHAMQQASEIVVRAVKRVEDRVREERVVRTLTRVVDRNFHQLNNDTVDPIVGMYRWVDKVVRLQRFVFPHRYLLEFQVPEPAAYVRWLETRNSERGFSNPAPVPFTLDGNPATDANPTLLPTDVSEDPASPGYYLTLASRWHATGVTAPPPPTSVASGWLTVPSADPSADKTSHDIWVTPLEGSAGAGGAAGGVDGEAIEIPDGYLADAAWSGWITSWDQDDGIRPGYNPGGDTFSDFPPTVFVTVGDSQNNPADVGTQRNLATNARSAISMPVGGQLSGRRTGTLPITVLAQNYGFIGVQVRVSCTRQANGALLSWQLDTHNRLRAAYFEMLRAHEDERNARAVQAGVVIEGRSPLENARMVREELKRNVIELLLGQRFTGVNAVARDATGRPALDIAASVAAAPLIQFLEQVFEWENLTYVLYPYFWADASQWDDLEGIASPDPDFARFLRSGSARVVVSARPGYACAVEYFLCTGIPWNGDAAPGPDDAEYISVADEIQAQTQAPPDGTAAGSSWEVRLPTTLVCLDPDPTLPKVNAAAELPDPPP
jgi:hypothetical protein